MLLDDEMIITTPEGEEKVMKILFTYDSEQRGNSYVFLYDEKDEDEISKKDLKDRQIYSVKESQIEFDSPDKIEKEALVIVSEIKELLQKTYYDPKSKTQKPITFSDIAVLSRSKNSN